MSAQSTSLLIKSESFTPTLCPWSVSNFSSIFIEGYACSKVTGNLSKNASLRTLVPMKRPSSEPLPFVFAVAITLKPALGETYWPIFLRNKPLPSRTGCRQSI